MSFEKKKTKKKTISYLIFCLYMYFVDSFFANDEQSLTKNKVVVLSLTQYS